MHISNGCNLDRPSRSRNFPEHPMTLRRLAGCLVALAVLLVWLHSLGLRMPYMDQVPVFDGDAMTTEASMWARIWWDQGPLHMWFSTPHAPRSIEAPERWLYESWPSGSFVPIYLTALLLGTEPSIPMVNWINTCEHGLMALAAAFIAFNIALQNRLGKVASGLIAVGVSLPILLSRGPIYVFSQIYDVTNAGPDLYHRVSDAGDAVLQRAIGSGTNGSSPHSSWSRSRSRSLSIGCPTRCSRSGCSAAWLPDISAWRRA